MLEIIVTLSASIILLLIFGGILINRRKPQADIDKYTCDICDESDCVCHKEEGD